MANRLTKGKGVFGALSVSGPITAASVASQGLTQTVGTKVSTAINVALVFKDGVGVTSATARVHMFYLADDAAGLTPSTVAPDGGIAIGTNGKLIKWTTNLSGMLISTAAGLCDITVTQSTAKNYYLVVVIGGGLSVSSVLAF